MPLKFVHRFYLIIFCCTTLFAYGQNEDTLIIYNQLWTDFNLDVQVNEKWSYGGDLGYRTQLDDETWSQIIVRPIFNYDHSKSWTFGGGIGSFNTIGDSIVNTYELRFQGEAVFHWPRLTNVSFKQRIRMDQRNYWFEGGGNAWEIRGRYYVGAVSRNFDFLRLPLQSYYFACSAEFFTPVFKESEEPTEYLVNSSRLTLIAGIWIHTDWKFEFDYTWQRGRILDLDEFQTSEHLIRLRLFMYLN
jgi:hypothetical protein